MLAPRYGALPTITAAPVSETNAELALGDAVVSVSHRTPVGASTLRALSEAGVRYVSARSVGVDHIDVEFARSVGIRVEGIAYSPDSVADYTLMLILMAVRHAKRVLVRPETPGVGAVDARGRELRDLTVGVVGTGRIGSAVLDRLRGFGCRVLTYDIRPGRGHDHVPLDELLRQSDIVTLHIPLTPRTQHLLDRRRIERMRRGAVVVNTARAALLETEALVSALGTGRLGGAALDVLEGETDSVVAALHAMPNVIVSPHTAYYTDHAVADMVENTLLGCLGFERNHQRG